VVRAFHEGIDFATSPRWRWLLAQDGIAVSGPTRPRPPGADSRRRMQMADLARLAGVSASTVSRALSGSPLISVETRERIQELARQFNYTVNSVATDLRSGVKRTIAVVVPYEEATRQSFSDPFLHGIIGALADVLTERGYEMLLSRVEADRLDSTAALVEGGRTAGLVLIGQWRQHEQLNAMAARGLPLVVWGTLLPNQRYCSVGGDNLQGGRLVAEHLLELGRRQVLFLGDTGLPEVAQRYEGFAAVLREHGIEHPPELCATVPFLAEAGRRTVLSLIESQPALDGIFASSDLLAMAAVGALRESGRQVPQQVAVVGYDDVALAAHFNPPLSTIRQPMNEAAVALVENLLAQLSDPLPPPSTVLETRLVIRESSRSPR
jgi:DNA-binding LacI/PurR family transcriptional regulator